MNYRFSIHNIYLFKTFFKNKDDLKSLWVIYLLFIFYEILCKYIMYIVSWRKKG